MRSRRASKYSARLLNSTLGETMKRRCPSCAGSTISVLGLALLGRPRCQSCRSSVGLHWLVAGAFACLASVLFGFSVLYLLTIVGPLVGFAGAMGVMLILSFAAAATAPLETKKKWWAP
jgi:hypothetical protein